MGAKNKTYLWSSFMLSSFTKMMPPQKKVILKDMRPYILGGGKKKKKKKTYLWSSFMSKLCFRLLK